MILTELFEVHPELNPKLWINNKLRPEVREKLLEVVEEFKDYYETPISVVDVIICGSNASFNYTDKSDIDLHIIANFEIISSDIVTLSSLYNLEKARFNSAFDISIHGVDVEVYVQDVNSSVVSNGIYSVLDNKWIKEPEVIDNFEQYDLTEEKAQWTQVIQLAILSGDREKLEKVLNDIYNIRKNSIARDGEFSKGNQLFKELRDLGLLADLKTAIRDSISKKLTLENYSTITEALYRL